MVIYHGCTHVRSNNARAVVRALSLRLRALTMVHCTSLRFVKVTKIHIIILPMIAKQDLLEETISNLRDPKRR